MLEALHFTSPKTDVLETSFGQILYESHHEKTCLMLYANNKGADQPAHPHSLISAFVVRCLDSIISILAISKISRLWLVSVAELAGLSFTW